MAKGNGKPKKEKSNLDHTASKLRKKGHFVQKDNLIPTNFQHEIDRSNMNRAERRLIEKRERSKKK